MDLYDPGRYVDDRYPDLRYLYNRLTSSNNKYLCKTLRGLIESASELVVSSRSDVFDAMLRTLTPEDFIFVFEGAQGDSFSVGRLIVRLLPGGARRMIIGNLLQIPDYHLLSPEELQEVDRVILMAAVYCHLYAQAVGAA